MRKAGIVALIFLIPAICPGVFACGDATAAEESTSAETVSSGTQPDCAKILEAIEQQRAMVQRETGQLKREIAALRQEMSNPGMKDVVAGIGYIFGITGLAMYFRSRKADCESPE